MKNIFGCKWHVLEDFCNRSSNCISRKLGIWKSLKVVIHFAKLFSKSCLCPFVLHICCEIWKWPFYYSLTSTFANSIGWKVTSLSIRLSLINSEVELLFPYSGLWMEYSPFQGLAQCPTSFISHRFYTKKTSRIHFYPSHFYRPLSRCLLSAGLLGSLLERRAQIFLVLCLQLKDYGCLPTTCQTNPNCSACYLIKASLPYQPTLPPTSSVCVVLQPYVSSLHASVPLT